MDHVNLLISHYVISINLISKEEIYQAIAVEAAGMISENLQLIAVLLIFSER